MSQYIYITLHLWSRSSPRHSHPAFAKQPCSKHPLLQYKGSERLSMYGDYKRLQHVWRLEAVAGCKEKGFHHVSRGYRRVPYVSCTGLDQQEPHQQQALDEKKEVGDLRSAGSIMSRRFVAPTSTTPATVVCVRVCSCVCVCKRECV